MTTIHPAYIRLAVEALAREGFDPVAVIVSPDSWDGVRQEIECRYGEWLRPDNPYRDKPPESRTRLAMTFCGRTLPILQGRPTMPPMQLLVATSEGQVRAWAEP